jgi:hypothetical protein
MKTGPSVHGSTPRFTQGVARPDWPPSGPAPERTPRAALIATGLVLALWLAVSVFASPLAAATTEVLTRIELVWIGREPGAFPSIP